MVECVVGIDVGGLKKGFHIAVIRTGHREVDALACFPEPTQVSAWLKESGYYPSVIGIDCPPRPYRIRSETRAAERELRGLGINVQWTRQQGQPLPEWMENGARLWSHLGEAFPSARRIECFPTAAGSGLATAETVLPLHLLHAHTKAREWKDLVDACICADTAMRVHLGQFERNRIAGKDDELGPIYY